MLTVYAAWTEGALESDIVTIREAMHRTDRPARPAIASAARDSEVNTHPRDAARSTSECTLARLTAIASEQLTGDARATRGSRLAADLVSSESGET